MWRLRLTTQIVLASLLVTTLAGCAGTQDAVPGEPIGDAPPTRPWVVVATLDTGTNPFHPTWLRENVTGHPSSFIPGYPDDARPLLLNITDDFEESVELSRPALHAMQGGPFPLYVPGTNLIGLWAAPHDEIPVFDADAAMAGKYGTSTHGAKASSQIAGQGYSLAPDVFLVIMDRLPQGLDQDQAFTEEGTFEVNADALRWAADQPWIDIIHTNIQNAVPLAGATPAPGVPGFPGYPEAVEYALSKGKLVVSAGGNYYVEATETSPHGGPSGVLVAGANDNCGYIDYSNPDPHVVMDGYDTVAASSIDWGNTTFGGTSSASPLVTGYAARLLHEVRLAYELTAGMQDGALAVLPDGAEPASGPLADGRLTAAELHEVIRKTADPNPHDSRFDGGPAPESKCISPPADLPVAFYPKMGYGEVSEHTLPHALAVLRGEVPMPWRPFEDAYFAASETLRDGVWR